MPIPTESPSFPLFRSRVSVATFELFLELVDLVADLLPLGKQLVRVVRVRLAFETGFVRLYDLVVANVRQVAGKFESEVNDFLLLFLCFVIHCKHSLYS